MKKLSNDLTTITFKEESKEIFMSDLTDQYNMPAGFNKKVRGISTAWNALEQSFTPTMTMNACARFLDTYGLDIHTYCQMD